MVWYDIVEKKLLFRSPLKFFRQHWAYLGAIGAPWDRLGALGLEGSLPPLWGLPVHVGTGLKALAACRSLSGIGGLFIRFLHYSDPIFHNLVSNRIR